MGIVCNVLIIAIHVKLIKSNYWQCAIIVQCNNLIYFQRGYLNSLDKYTCIKCPQECRRCEFTNYEPYYYDDEIQE